MVVGIFGNFQSLGKKTGGIRNQSKNQDYPKYSIAKID